MNCSNAGTKIVQGTVLANSAMTGDSYSWATVAPTVLLAGHVYRVMGEGAWTTNEPNMVYMSHSGVFASPAELVIGNGWGTPDEVGPNGTNGALYGDHNWWVDYGTFGDLKGFSTNFQYDVGVTTPEPATMGLLGLGLAGMIIRRRRK